MEKILHLKKILIIMLLYYVLYKLITIFMQRGKIVFTGHFGEYFIFSLGLLCLSIITLGIMIPYYFYWNLKYFFTHMEIEIQDKEIK